MGTHFQPCLTRKYYWNSMEYIRACTAGSTFLFPSLIHLNLYMYNVHCTIYGVWSMEDTTELHEPEELEKREEEEEVGWSRTVTNPPRIYCMRLGGFAFHLQIP